MHSHHFDLRSLIAGDTLTDFPQVRGTFAGAEEPDHVQDVRHTLERLDVASGSRRRATRPVSRTTGGSPPGRTWAT